MIVLLFILVSGALASLFLLPAVFVAQYRLQELKQTEEILKNNIAIANKQSLDATVSTANKKIATIEKQPAQSYIAIVDEIAAERTSDIKISSFSMQQSAPKMTITVKGNAKDRESLLDFANKLKQNTDFNKVDLPISNFAKDSDIDFTLSVTMK